MTQNGGWFLNMALVLFKFLPIGKKLERERELW